MIVIEAEKERFSQTWSDLLNLRSKTVLISFGTFAKSYHMPRNYKESIRAVAAAFPDVTFIWKYEVCSLVVRTGSVDDT